MSPVDPSKYDAIKATVNKKYAGAMKKGNEIENPERLSTGSLEMDVSMGGGVPMGRVTRLAGPYSSGKSLTGWSIISSAQALGMKCCYYNVEKQYTDEFVATRGVDTEALEVIDVTTIEGIAEICEATLGSCHVHVIDSTKAAVSEEVLAADVRAWRPGIEARAWGKAFAFLNDRMDYHENVIVLIDQVRVKNFTTGTEEPAGGKVLDHASSMTFMYRKGSWLKRDPETGFLTDSKQVKEQRSVDNQIIPAGRIIQGRVEKSRVSRPLLPATMWLDLDTNVFDRTFELKKHGIATGIIRQGGSYYYYVGPEGDETAIGQGEKAVREFLRGDVTVQEEIREQALKDARER